MSDATTFYKTLFGNLSWAYAPMYFLLDSRKGGRLSDRNVEEIAQTPHENIMTSCGFGTIEDVKAASTGRLKVDKIAGITSVWADIDIGKGDVTSPDQALQLMHDKGIPDPLIKDDKGIPDPSMVIHSGGGIHCWWLLTEPWVFADADERSRAGLLIQGFQKRLSGILGGGMDKTHDLARILRIPGTKNLKEEGNPRSVRIEHINDKRYNPKDFGDYKNIKPEPITDTQQRPNGDVIILDKARGYPEDRIKELCDLDSDFAASWFRSAKFDSPSEYDASITHYLLSYKFPDQQIVDCLLYQRIKHVGETHEKTYRLSYYTTTIANIRRLLQKESSLEFIEEYVEYEKEDKQLPEVRAKAMSCLSENLGISICGIKKYTSEPPTYSLEMDEGSVNIGNIDNLISQNLFRKKIAELTNKLPSPVKNDKWHTVADALLSIIEDVEVSEEATIEGSVMSWIREYLENRAIAEDPEPKKVTGLDPFVKNSMVCIMSSELFNFMGQRGKLKISPQIFSSYMAQAGFEKYQQGVFTTPKVPRSTRSAWRMPLEQLTAKGITVDAKEE